MEEPGRVLKVVRYPSKVGSGRQATRRTFPLTTRLVDALTGAQHRQVDAKSFEGGAATDIGCAPLASSLAPVPAGFGPLSFGQEYTGSELKNAPAPMPMSPAPAVAVLPEDVGPRLRVQVTLDRRRGSGRRNTPREFPLHVVLPELRQSSESPHVSPARALPQQSLSRARQPSPSPPSPPSQRSPLPIESPGRHESQLLSELAALGVELDFLSNVQLSEVQRWLPRPLSLGNLCVGSLINLARQLSLEREQAAYAAAATAEEQGVSSQQASFAPVAADDVTLAPADTAALAHHDLITAARTPGPGRELGGSLMAGVWRSPSPRQLPTPVEGVPELFFWPGTAARAAGAGRTAVLRDVVPDSRPAETCSTSGASMTPIEGVPERFTKRRRVSGVPRPQWPLAAVENTPSIMGRHAVLCANVSEGKSRAAGHQRCSECLPMGDAAAGCSANDCGADPGVAFSGALGADTPPADVLARSNADVTAGVRGDPSAELPADGVTCDAAQENLTAADIAAAASAAAREALRRLQALACTTLSETPAEAPNVPHAGSAGESEGSVATSSSGTPAVVKMQNLAVAVENAVQRATQAMGGMPSCHGAQSLPRAGLPPRPPSAAGRTTAVAGAAGAGKGITVRHVEAAELGRVGQDTDSGPAFGSIIHRAPPNALVFPSRTPSPMGGFEYQPIMHGPGPRRTAGFQDMVTPTPDIGMASFAMSCTPVAQPFAASVEPAPHAAPPVATAQVSEAEVGAPQVAAPAAHMPAPPAATTHVGAAAWAAAQIPAMPVAEALLAAVPVAAALMAAMPKAAAQCAAPRVAAAPSAPAPVEAAPAVVAACCGSDGNAPLDSEGPQHQRPSGGAPAACEDQETSAGIQQADLQWSGAGPSGSGASPTQLGTADADSARALASVLRHDLERQDTDDEQLAMEEVAALPDKPDVEDSDGDDAGEGASMRSNKDTSTDRQQQTQQQRDDTSGRQATHRASTVHAHERRLVVNRKSLANIGLTVDELGARRSTRNRVRPLEYWRGEVKTYGRKHKTMPTVKAIKMRTPEPQWPLPSGKEEKAKRRARAKEAMAAEAAIAT